MNKVKIGFPIEYECDDGIIRDGLFLREPEIKELEKRLKEINKITDLKQQVKKQKEVIDKAIKYFEENYYDCLDFNSGKRYKKLYHPEKLYDFLKEVSE